MWFSGQKTKSLVVAAIGSLNCPSFKLDPFVAEKHGTHIGMPSNMVGFAG